MQSATIHFKLKVQSTFYFSGMNVPLEFTILTFFAAIFTFFRCPFSLPGKKFRSKNRTCLSKNSELQPGRNQGMIPMKKRHKKRGVCNEQ